MDISNTLQALQLVYEKTGAESMASLSHMLMGLLSEACLRTVMASLHTFLLSFLSAMELVKAEESRRKPKEGVSVASAGMEETLKVASGEAETFGNQTVRLGLLAASQIRGDHVCKFQGQEHYFGISKTGDDSNLLPSPDTNAMLKKKDIAKWLMVAKKDDDDDEDDDDEDDDEDDDVEGDEEGGYAEGDDEDENEDNEDAADDEDDGDGEDGDEDGEGDDGEDDDDDDDDGDDDEDEDEDDEDEDDEDEEIEPPKKKSK